ncbi:glycosyltransferase involved in cell wall biosynthesis [Dysgonomonas sp. PFB1-18]|uniref:glycosyltransferase family 2 protein n=1 Tax=unclassified Dysgonomonas TaxID=2630389 RepID=UPI0024771D4C|nr:MULTISPECIES: glycosyltransferase family 2 protein [unclassified Dysgonomonas]MDH6308294.1 glycosyltransferase involved in cell wall biosynthesis [Dysgonomonas sp. PF1-14]MDH6338268.1 glycosyltransferase involved in cell wall biosynthesis [Dysgonomonas sp. PF1-16]MDH6379765.1 glycosyltransferase involved in cell wall biosynthesis [Dysgonomonas sp. PFB1-18]MDH6397145.1 glycosyltransferase involved in cell wall biosynthesis [Dysgonomonas sp. PF1-23]
MVSDLTIIVLTFNEEDNIRRCLDSIKGITDKILVVDSGSTDKTLDILQEYKVEILSHPFDNYSQQRNWAQVNNPFNTEWVFHLDAGECFSSELKRWILEDFDPLADYDGYMFCRRMIFLGRWIKHGGQYPIYHMRLFKADKGKCEEKVYDQHYILDGKKYVVKKGIDLIDYMISDLRSFTIKHNKWAIMEAAETIMIGETGDVKASIGGNPIEKRRWLKNNVFQKVPLFLRSFLYFNYRYFLCLGFLDGKEGLVCHFLQGFWFRFMVDATIHELRLTMDDNITLADALYKLYDFDINKLIYNNN